MTVCFNTSITNIFLLLRRKYLLYSENAKYVVSLYIYSYNRVLIISYLYKLFSRLLSLPLSTFLPFSDLRRNKIIMVLIKTELKIRKRNNCILGDD